MAPPDKTPDANRKRIHTAIRVSEAFRKKGFQVVQYGGATVEFYTAGRYSTGDVDIGFLGATPPAEVKSEVMQSLGSRRGVRIFVLDGVVVDLGGTAELYSHHLVELKTPEGSILLEAAEEEIAQRLLMGVYPQHNPDQWQAAKLLVGQAIAKNLDVDWQEVFRIVRLPAFAVEEELRILVNECSLELDLPKPPGF